LLQEKVTPLDLVLVVCAPAISFWILLQLVEGLFARGADDIGIDIVGSTRVIGKDDDFIAVDLGVSARDDDPHGAAAVLLAKVQADDTVTERTDLWRMPGPYAKLARYGNEDGARNGSSEEEPVGTHELAVKVSHVVLLLALGLHLGSPAAHVLDISRKAERLLGNIVALAIDDGGERADRVVDRAEHAGVTGELLGHVERLREELLDLAGAGDDELLLLREFVHAEDRDDVLEVGVLLERLLNRHGDAIVLLTHDGGIERGARARQRIDGRIDAQFGNGAREDRGGVEMRERGGGSRIGEVVGRNVDGLDRCDRPLLGGCDALLELAHLGCQRGLVADGGRHAAEKRRDLGAGLREAEDVVDEEQDVLALVAEELGGGEASEGDAHAGSGRLVHLAVDQAGLGDDTGLGHLEEEVGALAGTLADAGEDRRAAVLLGEVVDELLDEYRLADAGTTEESRLAATDVGLEKVDGLDAGLEYLGLGGEVLERRRGMVNRVVLDVIGDGLAVDRLTHDVPDATERGCAHRHHHRSTGVAHVKATLETVRR